MSAAGDDRTRGQRILYRVCRPLVFVLFTVIYRMRVTGARRLPPGPLIIVANHQSHLDPPLIGLAADRPLEYLARSGLFKNRAFAWLITGLGARPLDETGMDATGLRTALDRLAAGRALLVFPEGARSPDGAMRSFKRGTALLVRRAEAPVTPVAVEGVFDAWPRNRRWPRLFGARVAVRFGDPIDPATLMADGPDAALRLLECRIDAMRRELRAHLRSMSRGNYPPPGPADEAPDARNADDCAQG